MKILDGIRSMFQKRKMTVFLIIILLMLVAGIAAIGRDSVERAEDLQGESSKSSEDRSGENTNGEENMESSESASDKSSGDGDVGESVNASEGTDREQTTKNELISGENVKELIRENEEAFAEEELTCDNFASFSGQFVEDGTDELVNNVAAVLVTNHSEQFLNFAALQYEIDGQVGSFMVTGLPAGRSVWVMEESRMTVTESSTFTYIGCVTSFRENVITSTDQITISSDGNTLTAVNNTEKTLENVFVYYKVLHTDSNFFGGITYLTDFGTLEPGASADVLAGHYEEGNTEIVRIGWKEN